MRSRRVKNPEPALLITHRVRIVDSYSRDDIADYVQENGLGHAIQRGLSAKRISDPHLAELWLKAKLAMEAVEEYLDIDY